MYWTDNVQKAISYIENNLYKEICNEEIASYTQIVLCGKIKLSNTVLATLTDGRLTC